MEGSVPEFVLVAYRGDVITPLDHLGFQCESRAEVSAIAERARSAGSLVEGPVDAGGSVGYYAVVREPSGHLVEFTWGQPLAGLRSRVQPIDRADGSTAALDVNRPERI